MTQEVYIPYPFAAEPTDIITHDQAEVAQKLIEDVRDFCGENLTKPYEVSKTAFARGIKVLVEDTEVEKLQNWKT